MYIIIIIYILLHDIIFIEIIATHLVVKFLDDDSICCVPVKRARGDCNVGSTCDVHWSDNRNYKTLVLAKGNIQLHVYKLCT